jgi:hypothetical protein
MQDGWNARFLNKPFLKHAHIQPRKGGSPEAPKHLNNNGRFHNLNKIVGSQGEIWWFNDMSQFRSYWGTFEK